MRKPILITRQGLAGKEEELATLSLQRTAAVQELEFAREQGDRSENGAYKAARWKLSGLDRRIRQVKDVLRRARIVERSNTDTVEIGATVVLKKNGETIEYLIVGSEESDLQRNQISYLTPLAKAILGKKAGDAAIVITPGGILNLVVTQVR